VLRNGPFERLLAPVLDDILKVTQCITLEGPHVILRLTDLTSTHNFDYSAYKTSTGFSVEFIINKSGSALYTKSAIRKYMESKYISSKFAYYGTRAEVYLLDSKLIASAAGAVLADTGWILISTQIHSELVRDRHVLMSKHDDARTEKLEEVGLSILRSAKTDITAYKLSAAGGFQGVGRSNYYLRLGQDTTIMLDAGITPSGYGPILPVLKWADVNLGRVNAIVISHCHVDHTGFLGCILELAYDGPIYMTMPTFELCIRVIKDTIKLNPDSVTELTMDKLITNTVIVGYNTRTTVKNGITILLNRANHVLGASTVNVSHDRFKFLFTGDFKYCQNHREIQSILKPVDPLIFKRQYTAVLTQATLCDKSQSYEPLVEAAKLSSIIMRANEACNNVIVPCFSMGREFLIHTIVTLLSKLKQENKLNLSLYLDRGIHQSLLHHMDHPDLVDLPGLRATNQFIVDENKPVNHDEKFIIIASSGMCEGGTILGFLPHYLDKEDTLVLFTGYQSKNSLGGEILAGLKEYQFAPGQIMEIRCMTQKVSVGRGHSTYNNLFHFWNKLNIKERILFTHGEAKGLNLICAEWNRLRGGLNPVGCAPYCGDEILLANNEKILRL
jgi:predicted metal-dependent RNase